MSRKRNHIIDGSHFSEQDGPEEVFAVDEEEAAGQPAELTAAGQPAASSNSQAAMSGAAPHGEAIQEEEAGCKNMHGTPTKRRTDSEHTARRPQASLGTPKRTKLENNKNPKT